MSLFLHALSLKFYRGIGPVEQKITGLVDFNFFIGANNAGKSIVLNFLAHHLKTGGSGLRASLVEKYRGSVTGETEFSVGISLDNFVERVLAGLRIDDQLAIREHVRSIALAMASDGFIWMVPNERGNLSFATKYPDIRNAVDFEKWRSVWMRLTQKTGGGIDQHWVPETVQRMAQSQYLHLPDIHLVPAKRVIGPAGESMDDLSGRGLIDRLVEIQSPDHDRYDTDKAQFSKINSFLEAVTDTPGARIEIPHNKSAILVHMNNKVLPLSSLGTGIHEVVLIAAISTIHDRCIMCIEEPEIHLHPILQRKLVRYLKEQTSNQYFIATHSAAFIDTPGAAIFHVSNNGSQTFIRGTQLKAEKYELCADLGYKASDILQANAVIWVEGPSDRIYLKRWIAEIDNELEEGVHYSIMFYGGRLLSHLSAEDEGIQEFIQLKSLNRNSAIVIDSDRTRARPFNAESR